MVEPRLYSFEVSLSWSHNGAEYRVALFSKLKTKDWPNPTSLLGILSEVLYFLHSLHALQTVALELHDEQRRLVSTNSRLQHDFHTKIDVAQAAEARAGAAENEAIRLRESVLQLENEIEGLKAKDTLSDLTRQIQVLKQDKLQLAADLSAATAIADEIQQEGCKYAVSMESLKFEALERERTARNAYNDSLTNFEEECKAKLQELDIRCLELEDCLASERLVSEQLRAKIDYALVHVSSEVEALNVSVEAADRTLRSLAETLKRYTDSTREAGHSIDYAFQKKIVRSANAKCTHGGARMMQIGPPHDLFNPIDSFFGRSVINWGTGMDMDVEELMRQEFSDSERPVESRKYGGIESTLALEWQFAVEPRADVKYPGQVAKVDPVNGQAYPTRIARQIEALMKHDVTLRAKLVRSEVIALSLYTGAAHGLLNEALRDTASGATRTNSTSLLPLCSAATAPSPFLTTVTVLNSAIKKLMRITDPSICRYLFSSCVPRAAPSATAHHSNQTYHSTESHLKGGNNTAFSLLIETLSE